MADVTFSGPLFDSEGDAILADGVLAARHAVADRGAQLVKAAFADRIVVNQDRFVNSFVTIDESTTFTSAPNGRKAYALDVDVPQKTTVVTTTQAAYGPWLNGTGSRNATTRFKGYWGFREAASALDEEAQGIADDALGPYIDKLNG